MAEISEIKAPWDLKGKGYIFIFKFKKGFSDERFCVPDFLKGKYCGGFGSVMLVDYQESTAGPYQEFLFIPGKFKFENKKLDCITKIFVSTEVSVQNGRKNWGIPKELANFKFEQKDKKNEKIEITIGDEKVAEFEIESHSFRFPVNTKLLPFPLVQQYEDKYFYTNFFGKGKGRFAKVKNAYINKKYFPDFTAYKPIAVLKVEPFSITFPIAKTKS